MSRHGSSDSGRHTLRAQQLVDSGRLPTFSLLFIFCAVLISTPSECCEATAGGHLSKVPLTGGNVEAVIGVGGHHEGKQGRSLRSELPALPKAFLPVPLPPENFKPGTGPGKWHLLITSCDTRHNWGRMITTTLLTAIASDMEFASISILWCRSLSQQLAKGKPLPSLLYNLRMSSKIHVFMQSEALQVLQKSFITKLLFSQLSIPTVLGNTSLPLIIIEDDVVWDPHAGQRLHEAISLLPNPAWPFALSLYSPAMEVGPVADVTRGAGSTDDSDINETARPARAPLGGVRLGHEGSITQLRGWRRNRRRKPILGVPRPRSRLLWNLGPLSHAHYRFSPYCFGTQGIAFSANMVPKLLPRFVDMVEGRAQELPHLQDMALMSILHDDWQCTSGNNCYFYTIIPSALQHIGTHSALFAAAANKTGNARFHLSDDYPHRTRFPGFEADDTW